MSIEPAALKLISTVSLVAGGGLFLTGGVWGAWSFFRGRKEEEPGQDQPLYETSLVGVAKRAGWVVVDDDTARWDDVRNLYPGWREPHSLRSMDRPLYVNAPTTDLFYNEHVRSSALFRKLDAHRAVIIQLLELLDKHKNEPSVVVKGKKDSLDAGDERDNDYDEKSYTLLANVSLYAHTLNVAKLVCDQLRKEQYEFRLPNALIAALAHDVGKIAALRQGASSREHPLISCDYLQTLEGFNQITARKEILSSIRFHHSEAGATWLAKLLRRSDHEARKLEYQEQHQLVLAQKKSKQPPPPVESQPWVQQYEGPTLEDLCRHDPIGDPNVILPYVVPAPEEDTEDHTPETDQPGVAASPGPLAAEDNGQTLRDPLLVKVERWVQETDLEEYSIASIMDEFQVSAARAEALFDALTRRGIIATQDAPATEVPAPHGPSPASQEQADFFDILAIFPKENIVFPPDPSNEDTTGPLLPYGTVSALDALPPDTPRRDEDVEKDYAEITNWFDPVPFLQNLRTRINVDKAKPRPDCKRNNKFFQAVSYQDSVYVHVYALKEIIADQMIVYGDAEGAERMLSPPSAATDKIKGWQRQNIMKVLRYFRHSESGVINPAKFPENHMGVECVIKFIRGKEKEGQLMIPFDLIAFGDVNDLLARKKSNPLVNNVAAIVPEHSSHLH